MDVFYRVHLQWYSCPSRPLFEHCHYGNRSLMPCTLSGLLYLNSFLVFSTKPFTEPQLIQDSVRGEVFAWWGFFCLHYRVSSKRFSLPLMPCDRFFWLTPLQFLVQKYYGCIYCQTDSIVFIPHLLPPRVHSFQWKFHSLNSNFFILVLAV